jgi:hypothetical protein
MNKDIERFDNMSNKESMRGSHHKEGWCMKMYDQGRDNYKIVSRYIDRCLKKSIGKNFDKVKKHIYEKMSHNIIARHEDNIVDRIICRYIGESRKYNKYTLNKYILDSQNRIQLNKEYIKRNNKWSEDKKNSKLTIIDKDKEISFRIKDGITDNEINKLKNMLINNGSYNKEVFNHIFNGGILSQKKYMEFINSIKYDAVINLRYGYDYIYDTKKYAESLFTIYDDNVVYIFDNVNSSEYIRYKKEISDRKRKERREYKKAKDEYNEDLLFCLEYKKKQREEEKNNIDRDRLGFDEESFKGEPYHGQKRKKKKQ